MIIIITRVPGETRFVSSAIACAFDKTPKMVIRRVNIKYIYKIRREHTGRSINMGESEYFVFLFFEGLFDVYQRHRPTDRSFDLCYGCAISIETCKYNIRTDRGTDKIKDIPISKAISKVPGVKYECIFAWFNKVRRYLW